MTKDAVITVRDVLRLLLATDSYPCLGNGDWHVCDLLEAEALEKARTAVPCADDPPAFGPWLETLQKHGLHNPEREEVYFALHDFFDNADRNASLDPRLANQP
jgi:hypothetical protein